MNPDLTGVITGGEGYVVAAYVAAWFTLGAYALSLYLRRRALDQELP